MLKRWMNLLLGFLVGLAGNLVAGWIQQDVWSNVFTPTRILVTVAAVLLALVVIALLEKKSPSLLRRRNSISATRTQKAEPLEKDAEEKRKEAVRGGIGALDSYEKAVLREFLIQKRNTILVPEEDTAVAGLLQKGIIRIIGDGKQVLGVGWVYPVSLSSSAAAIIKGSSQVIGFPPGMPTPEQVKKIQSLRPSFVWDIERSNW